ncbi:leucine-rich repeat domain-containing protein [Chitinophaga filiformis]|uniref:Leucine rich repeat-containing protein n=1 Tax=Chitinophaga filiformis TaxID=104663 RepID=A0A1G8CHS6_CHIFI|nr:leucine-rich repeat domain-containing protein [Chitinophaga filiformis]SDH45024.1 Leucine rich repeat-containing protein [Chitinophaga filiformis]
MTKLSLLLITILVLNSCRNCELNKSVSNDPRIHIGYDPQITIDSSDILIFTTSRRKEYNTGLSDSTNSLVQISGDTLGLFLNDGRFEGCYLSSFIILPDTAYSTFELFDAHTKYNYLPSSCSISLNKNTYRPGDYLTVQINYKTIGKHTRHEDVYDTVTIIGKIKLKIRDRNFTQEDFSIERNRNEFLSLLKQKPDTITELNLFGCAFTRLPQEITQFVNLQKLNLDGNDLSGTDLSELKQLRHLKSLELHECNLSHLPEAILSLSELESLDIFQNNISAIPEELYNLTSIKHLCIGGNNISYLSPRIANLINLETFETSSSKIKVYPKEMTKLKKLKDLYPNDTMDYIPGSLLKYVWHVDTVYHH